MNFWGWDFWIGGCGVLLYFLELGVAAFIVVGWVSEWVLFMSIVGKYSR